MTPIIEQKHIISLLVNNKPGVLIRIALVFARRAYNIDSLVTHSTNDPNFSTITISASGNEKSLSLILKQLVKLVDVIHAKDRSKESVITQEMVLIKCRFDVENRSEILHLIKSFEGNILDVTKTSIIFSYVDSSDKLDTITHIFTPYEIIEIIRTGSILMLRGEHATTH